MTNPGNSGTYSDNLVNNFTYGDNLTWEKEGTSSSLEHSIRYQQNIIYSGVSGAEGVLTYSGSFTSDPVISGNASTPLAAVYSLADFNPDRVYAVGRSAVAGYVGQRQWRDAAFAQDDRKLPPNFMLNLGVRWEWDQPIYKVNNKQSNLNLQTGQVEIAEQNDNSRAL